MINNAVVPLELPDSMAVKIIRECVDKGRVIFTHHATERMVQRNIDRAQVYDCLRKGTGASKHKRQLANHFRARIHRADSNCSGRYFIRNRGN